MKFGIFYEHQLPRPWAEGAEQQLFNEALDQVELADRLGIDFAWEVEHLVDAGFEPWQALGAATWVGGDLLREPEAGKISVGGPADFFFVHGNPLQDPSALWRVWKVA